MRTGIYVVIIVMKIINVDDCNFHDVNENEYTLFLSLFLLISASRVDIKSRRAVRPMYLILSQKRLWLIWTGGFIFIFFLLLNVVADWQLAG